MRIDATGVRVEKKVEVLSDNKLLKKIQDIDKNVVALKQYFTNSANPIVVIAVDKKRSQLELFKDLAPLAKYISILVVVDKCNNDLENPYMLIWRVTNNIDALRDIVLEPNLLA